MDEQEQAINSYPFSSLQENVAAYELSVASATKTKALLGTPSESGTRETGSV